jgi:hypothetical protein
LIKDILKVNLSFEKKGEWTQLFQHRKVIQNVGPCQQQYPHIDYDYAPKPNEKGKATNKNRRKKAWLK